MKRAIRVMIADDNALFRLGLARLLKDDRRLEVVADAADGKEAAEMAAIHNPDVVLMDSRMPNMDGIEALQRITAQQPDVKVLFLSSFENESDVLQAMRRGAGGYVLKDALPDAIINSIISVDSGERVLSDVVAKRVVEIASGVRRADEASDGLTAREIEVLKLMSSGLANKQIAFRLRISEKTVRNHISHIYEKIGVVDRAQAALYSVRKGLIEA
jgi:two-component system, NarL family, response regulator LiaR